MYLQRLKRGLSVLLDLEKASSHLTYRPSDTFLVSYPRSGNTWLRFLIGNLLHPSQPMSFLDLADQVPDIYHARDRHLRRMESLRFLKSHEPYKPEYRRVIYVVRDPRDVLISYYYYQVKFHRIPENYPIAEFAQRFFDGDLDPYGPWNEHVGGWHGARANTSKFLLLRYEDMISDVVAALNRIQDFLDLERTQEDLQKAAEFSSFENMQNLESRQMDSWEPLKSTLKGERFVRSGKVGEGREALPTHIQKLILESWSEVMARVGYDCSS